eukprot:CAMPEP_0180829634 /NCGR_PEP_ID=MMETSP1038_2-20121128/75366_1 /TAXON_ID=632150 /ORGANISM="Azadinium spinosum, Strain 3D9" /LENGTH=266 /DNA_ID=CAMNT_0022872691 /DNA_START=75 /DNA_END=871 /DNA_ORIENTATION=-
MKGPNQNQFVECTLGKPCNIKLTGESMGIIPGEGCPFKLMIVEDIGDPRPCGTGTGPPGGLATTFEKLDNPDTVANEPVCDTYELKTAISKDTDMTKTYALCWGLSPIQDQDMTHHIGFFTMYGPIQKNFWCTMGLPCELVLDGTGFVSSNALLLAIGNDLELCRLLAVDLVPQSTDLFSLGAGFKNPNAVNDSTPHGSYLMGKPLEPHQNAELNAAATGYEVGYRVCWGSTWDSNGQLAADIADDTFQIDIGVFNLYGPVAKDFA